MYSVRQLKNLKMRHSVFFVTDPIIAKEGTATMEKKSLLRVTKHHFASAGCQNGKIDTRLMYDNFYSQLYYLCTALVQNECFMVMVSLAAKFVQSNMLVSVIFFWEM